jgi:uncharacterized protein (TIGR03790 family)
MRLLVMFSLVVLLAEFAFAAQPAAPNPDAARTIVVASETVPEGVAVAKHYMEVRGIPAENLCLVKAPADEEITRDEFNATLWQPLRAFLARWEGRVTAALPDGAVHLQVRPRRAKYLVPVYGVPIKIKGYEDVKTMYLSSACAVDSELALLPTGDHGLTGSLRNPYFGADAPFGPPVDEAMVLVTRLDGPSAEIATRLVDDAVWAEQQGGLKGRAYVDTRGIAKGPYLEGDVWLRNAALRLAQAGFKTDVDVRPEVLPLSYPMPDPGIYLGWYTDQAVGPMVATDFKFNRGAVAYHLQSFTGAAIRDPKTHWVGPLLAHGACVTAGAVYEPFLAGTPHIDIMMDRLLKGYSWGEAAYMAEAFLSWQMCFLGDPLYRPFPKGK